jgi:GNAT superfamily N-acetyltransferase
MMTTQGVDENRAIAVLALAFGSDPMARWAWPDPHQYLSTCYPFFRAMGGAAFEHGTAFVAPDYLGASLWLPPGVSADEKVLMEMMQRTVAAELHEDMFAVFEQMAGYHPSEPHWYLPLIGVDPMHQGKGIGVGLMRPALEACDRDGVPAYLESSNPRNISFYERLGFTVLGTIQSGSSPEVTPMVRRPRS